MRSILITLSFIGLFSMETPAYSQTQTTSQNDAAINKLLEQRKELIQQHRSHKSVDLELSQLGHLPKAIIKETYAGTQQTLSFAYYRNNINSNNITHIRERLMGSFPGISSIDVDMEKEIFTVSFKEKAQDTTIESLVNIFGYKNYEIEK